MFDSGITAESLVEEIISEVDAAPDIPPETYYEWLDEAEQLLYSEIIHEQAKASAAGSSPVTLASLKQKDADTPRFEDICAVYADKKQLARVSMESGETFPDTYWKEEDALCFRAEPKPGRIRVYYYVRPERKSQDPTNTVKLPPEWVQIIRAKLRGEAYMLVNEDSAAAKWIDLYNVLLEQFKQYMSARSPEIGGW